MATITVCDQCDQRLGLTRIQANVIVKIDGEDKRFSGEYCSPPCLDLAIRARTLEWSVDSVAARLLG